jgi:hypothetical protein
MGAFFTRTDWKIFILLVVFGFAGLPAMAQIMSLSRAEIKAQTRKSQKEAARYEADHKETHLETENFPHKKGRAGRKQVRVEEEPAEFVHDKEINAIYEERRDPEPKDRARKSKKEKK